MQFEQVEAGPRRRHELAPYRQEFRGSELTRRLAARRVGNGRRPADLPVAVRERIVHALPHEPGRALAAGVPELDADPGSAIVVDERGDPAPGLFLLAGVDAGAAGRDPPGGGDADHL